MRTLQRQAAGEKRKEFIEERAADEAALLLCLAACGKVTLDGNEQKKIL